MIFTFKLSTQDLASFQKLVNRRLTIIAKANSKLFVANIIAWIPLGYAMASCARIYRKYPEITHDLNEVLASVVVGIVLLIICMLYKRYLYRNAVRSQDTFSEQTMEADSEGIKLECAVSRGSYKWSAFIHSTEDTSNIYLFLDNTQALI